MNAIMAHNSFALPHAVIDRTALQIAMETGIHAVEKRGSYPILSNVRLTGDGNTLFVTTTDLDMEIVSAIPAAADAGFDITVTAHILRDLLKKAPAAEFVAFSQPEIVESKGSDVFDGQAGVEFDAVAYHISAIHPGDFPTFKAPSHNEARHFTLPGETLRDALDNVAFAISNEETRYYLNGVYMEVRDGNLVFVATDGHRLCKQVLTAPEGAEGMPGAILPKKLVYTLQKLWDKKNTPDSVSLSVEQSRVRIQFGNVTITSKAIDGTFPDYQRVIPRNNDKAASIEIATLQKALEAVTVIAAPKGSKAVKFDFSDSGVTMTFRNPDQGTATTTIDAEVGFSDGLVIGFNAKYVGEFLKNLKGGSETITLTFNDAGSPTLITSDREGWLGVLMPMRV